MKAMKTKLLSLPEPKTPTPKQPDRGAHEDYKRLVSKMDRQNVWVPSMGTTMAVWGCENVMALLARTLDRAIIVLDGRTMLGLRNRRNANAAGLRGEVALHQYHAPQSKKLFHKLLNTIGVLLHLETDEDALVLEHINDNHYHCLVRKGVAPGELPLCLTKALAEGPR